MERRKNESLAQSIGAWIEPIATTGLIGSAAFAAALGQLSLALILAAFALGLFLRFRRGRARIR